MATPTGFKFLYNSVQTDFADVFQISYPNPGITTGYKSAAYGNLDLGQIFTAGNSGISTSYKYSTNIDLGSIFALIPFYTATGTYTEYTFNGYTGVVFPYDAASVAQSITFSSQITVNLLLVAGGGGSGYFIMGGGAGGGGIEYNTSFLVNLNQYSIVVGKGGTGGYFTTVYIPGTSGTSSSISNNANTIIVTGGGVPYVTGGGFTAGGLAGLNNYGTPTGGAGGDYDYSSDGKNSSVISITMPFLDPSIYLNTVYLSGGGGSAITSIFVPNPTYTYGGGQSGKGIGGISGYITAQPQIGESGVNSISTLGSGSISGFGGGGGATPGSSTQSSPILSGNGGNGVVIFWWQN